MWFQGKASLGKEFSGPYTAPGDKGLVLCTLSSAVDQEEGIVTSWVRQGASVEDGSLAGVSWELGANTTQKLGENVVLGQKEFETGN